MSFWEGLSGKKKSFFLVVLGIIGVALMVFGSMQEKDDKKIAEKSKAFAKTKAEELAKLKEEEEKAVVKETIETVPEKIEEEVKEVKPVVEEKAEEKEVEPIPAEKVEEEKVEPAPEKPKAPALFQNFVFLV